MPASPHLTESRQDAEERFRILVSSLVKARSLSVACVYGCRACETAHAPVLLPVTVQHAFRGHHTPREDLEEGTVAVAERIAEIVSIDAPECPVRHILVTGLKAARESRG